MAQFNPQIPNLNDLDYLRYSHAYEAPYVYKEEGQRSQQILPEGAKYAEAGPKYQGVTFVDQSGRYRGEAQGLAASGKGAAIGDVLELGAMGTKEVDKTITDVATRKAHDVGQGWQDQWTQFLKDTAGALHGTTPSTGAGTEPEGDLSSNQLPTLSYAPTGGEK